MARSRLTIAVLAAGVVGLGPGVARSQDGNVAALLVPATEGSRSTLELSGSGDAFTGDPKVLPESLSVLVERGFQVDPEAVTGRCEKAQAEQGACPADSRVGTGKVEINVQSVLLGPTARQFEVAVDAFATAPSTGEVAGVLMVAAEPQTRIRQVVRGGLRRRASGPYGYELRFDGFPAPPPLSGATVTLNSFRFALGAKRTVTGSRVVRRRVRVHGVSRVRRVRVTVRRRLSLITNPARCDGDWAALIRVKTSAGQVEREIKAACRATT